MRSDDSSRLTAFIPTAVLALLIGAFFLVSRHPHIPVRQLAYHSEDAPHVEIPSFASPAVKVWVSRDELFIWNREKPAPLEQLPMRIASYVRKTGHRFGLAEVSAEELARLEKVAFAISELKKAGFPDVTIVTKPKADPTDPSW